MYVVLCFLHQSQRTEGRTPMRLSPLKLNPHHCPPVTGEGQGGDVLVPGDGGTPALPAGANTQGEALMYM